MAKVMIVIGFLVAFAAGLTVGREVRHPPRVTQGGPVDPAAGPRPGPSTGPTTRQGRGSGWFASQLKLTPEQQKQMDAIWSAVARGGREETERKRDALRKQRDEQILGLVGPDNKAKYDAIQQQYRDQHQGLEREMRGRFEQAVKDTEAILDPEQREKYKELLARHRPPDRDGRDGGRGRGGLGGPDGQRGPGGSPDENKPEHRRGDGGATPTPAPQP